MSHFFLQSTRVLSLSLLSLFLPPATSFYLPGINHLLMLINLIPPAFAHPRFDYSGVGVVLVWCCARSGGFRTAKMLFRRFIPTGDVYLHDRLQEWLAAACGDKQAGKLIRWAQREHPGCMVPPPHASGRAHHARRHGGGHGSGPTDRGMLAVGESAFRSASRADREREHPTGRR